MGWYRSNVRFGSWLALLALALSLALSFKHVHLGHAAAAPVLSVAADVVDEGAPSGGSVPADDPICSICVLIHIAGTLVHPVAPALELPRPAVWVEPDTIVASPVWVSPIFSFNARGPPACGVTASHTV